MIVRIADVAFRQSSAEVVPATLEAMARYLPGLPLVFFEYDPVSVVVAVPAFFQPPPLALRWILTGTAATQAVKGGSSVELTTPLALPFFFSFSVMDLVCPPAGAQSGGGDLEGGGAESRPHRPWLKVSPGSVRLRQPDGTKTAERCPGLRVGNRVGLAALPSTAANGRTHVAAVPWSGAEEVRPCDRHYRSRRPHRSA